MAQQRLSMRKIREVLRLVHELGLSNRQIAASLKMSHSTVGEYRGRARQVGLEWPLAPECDDARLEALLFPPPPPASAPRPLPDWSYIYR